MTAQLLSQEEAWPASLALTHSPGPQGEAAGGAEAGTLRQAPTISCSRAVQVMPGPATWLNVPTRAKDPASLPTDGHGLPLTWTSQDKISSLMEWGHLRR